MNGYPHQLIKQLINKFEINININNKLDLEHKKRHQNIEVQRINVHAQSSRKPTETFK